MCYIIIAILLVTNIPIYLFPMPKINPEIQSFARIKVIGVGGSGGNAINHMIASKVRGIDFIAMNTDTQDLHKNLSEKKIHLGKNLTKGLGAGMNPEVGRKSAEETKTEIQDSIKGSDMAFIACGLGGGTGTGAAPVVARASKEQGILTVAVITRPFFFEGEQRRKIADAGLRELEKEVDAIITIPNDRLLSLADKDMSFDDAFAMSDEILRQAVEGISDLITTPGRINVDFADIKAIMSDAGSALMGIGYAAGEGRAEKAAIAAINSPLLEISITGAKGVLFAISGGADLGIQEVNTAAKIITESIDKDAKVIFGTIKDEKLKKGEIKVTVIATGFPASVQKKTLFGNNPTPVPEIKEEPKDKARIAEAAEEEYLKKKKKIEVVEEDETEDGDEDDDETEDEDDWNAIPAFLRRKK
jgi:cell division protein FtsZ